MNDFRHTNRDADKNISMYSIFYNTMHDGVNATDYTPHKASTDEIYAAYRDYRNSQKWN